MTIADKLTQIAENTPKVYEAGKAEGYAEAEAITIGLIEGTLAEIVVPAGTKKIGGYAFDNMPSLKKITIPEGVEQICAQALSWTGIAELELPLSCHTIDSLALQGIWSCKTMRMGNVTSIGEKAFVQCNALVELDFTKCDSVPALASTNAFDNYCLKNNPKILVPAELYGEWIAATNWAEYADLIVPDGLVPSKGLDIDDNGSLIGRGTCTDTVIVVPDEVKRIEMYSFVEDTSLDTLILPERDVGVYIDDYSVYGSSLRVVENFYSSGGLALAGCPLELVTFLPSANHIMLGALNLNNNTTYDFSRHAEIPRLTFYETDFYDFSEGTQFIVPASLYDEWINDTNWVLCQPYIIAAES